MKFVNYTVKVQGPSLYSSPWLPEDADNSIWNSFCAVGSPETGPAARGRWPSIAIGCVRPSGLVTIFWVRGWRIGRSIKLLGSCGNQIWLGHTGDIKVAVTFSSWSLLRQVRDEDQWWKHVLVMTFPWDWESIDSTVTAAGSGFQLQYSRSWAFILDANMSIEKEPNLFSNCSNTSQFSFQLLESVLCHNSHVLYSYMDSHVPLNTTIPNLHIQSWE